MLFEEYLPKIQNEEAWNDYINFINDNKESQRVEGCYYETHHIVHNVICAHKIKRMTKII